MAAASIVPIGAQRTAAGGCRVTGRAASGSTPLPGVSIAVKGADGSGVVTSSDVDGGYTLSLAPGTYLLTAALTGFTSVEQSITIDTGGTCDQSVPISLSLAPRQPLETSKPVAPATPGSPASPRPSAPANGSAAAASGRGRGAGANGAATSSSFQSVDVQTLAATSDTTSTESQETSTRLLLPPGFSTDTPADAIAINGNAASLDRGMMNDRFGAIGRGEVDPVTGEVAGGRIRRRSGRARRPRWFRRPRRRGRPWRPGRSGRIRRARRLSRRPWRPAEPDLRDGQLLVRRVGARQQAVSAARRHAAPDTPYTHQSFGGTIGGPLKIPHVYDGTRRTSFVLTYNGSRGTNLFDQYATVPSDAMRAGNFSGSAALIDPVTGAAFPGNQIPANRIDTASTALLPYIPLPNLPGSSRNFHNASTAASATDSASFRLTHNFTPSATGRGGGFGRGGGGGFGGGRAGERGPGQAQTGTSVTMTAQFQYRRADNDVLNVLPALGGRSSSSSLTAPVTLNIRHNRSMVMINFNASQTTSQTTNQYAGITDVAGNAGISGVSTEPFDWGIPALSFSSLSNVRDVTPLDRTDRRISLSSMWMHPYKQHLIRIGGDVRVDRSSSDTDPNAAGAFVFTGLYTSGGLPVARNSGSDFADFLLGLPQQASVQYGPGTVTLRGRETSLFAQDDWRMRSNLTFNLGIRYELIWPFVEADGHLVNLDVAPDFTAAVPVLAGQTGPFHGAFPAALINTDTNNLAPRLGMAWRIKPGTIFRPATA